MGSKMKEDHFEEQINLINRNSQTDAIPDHYDVELKSGEKYHLQRVDSDLNRDAIVFTAELAALAGLNTVVYHKYTAPHGAPYVYSEYFEEGKTWFSGEGLTNSYVIEEIRRQFSAKDPDKGEETFLKYCQMIILDLFSLNCDRTHNNWRQNGNDILIFDYNFTFGSAELLHGLSNAQLTALSSTGIRDYPKGKNRFLNAVYERNHELVMQDLVDYTIQKSIADAAHTRTEADAADVSLLGSFKGLIHYFRTQNIGTELIEFYLNLSANRVLESIPEGSQITVQGNKEYLASIFEHTKSMVRELYES